MKYEEAKDIFSELKNFEGKATFSGSDTVIDHFVLLPQAAMAGFDIYAFLETHLATTGFEIEGDHDNEEYTIIGISEEEKKYSNDVEYFRKLLVW